MKIILSYLYSFLTDGLLFVSWFFPMYVFLRVFLLKNRKKRHLADTVSAEREIILSGLVIYLILLFTQTFVVNAGSNMIQLIPFQIIISQFRAIFSEKYGLDEFLFNIIGNIAVFIPIGIMTTYLFHHNLFKAAFNGFIISLFIETVQIPLERTTDIDDIILNTTGAVIGYFTYQTIKRIIKKRTTRQR